MVTVSLDDVRASFAKQGVMALLGAELVSAEEGRVVVELAWRPDLTQQDGCFHAGILTSIADSAGGYAAQSLMPAGHRVLATEFQMHFIRPGAGERAVAIGTVLRQGKRLSTCELEVYVDRGGERILAAKGLQSCLCLPAASQD